MVKAPFFDNNGVKKGAWSQEEDNKLRAYVERYGHWNWRELPKYAGLSRCGKSCRLRWMNYLRPGIKLGNYSREEENLIIKLHEQFGNRWSRIAVELPGRTDNEIKNYWHTHVKKVPKKTQINKSMEEESSEIINNNDINLKVENHLSHQILESCPLSPQSSSSEMSPLTSGSPIFTTSSTSTNAKWLLENTFTSLKTFENISNGDDFWTQPFVPDQDCYRPPSLDGGLMSSYITCYEDSVDLFSLQLG